MCGGSPSRYDSYGVFSFDIGDEENLAVNHADDHEAFFIVIFPVVKKLRGKRVVEHARGQVETDSVFREVVLGFGLVPLEVQIPMLRATSS